MSLSVFELSQRLIRALDKDYNVSKHLINPVLVDSVIYTPRLNTKTLIITGH